MKFSQLCLIDLLIARVTYRIAGRKQNIHYRQEHKHEIKFAPDNKN
jgi:hypothetical protein